MPSPGHPSLYVTPPSKPGRVRSSPPLTGWGRRAFQVIQLERSEERPTPGQDDSPRPRHCGRRQTDELWPPGMADCGGGQFILAPSRDFLTPRWALSTYSETCTRTLDIYNQTWSSLSDLFGGKVAQPTVDGSLF